MRNRVFLIVALAACFFVMSTLDERIRWWKPLAEISTRLADFSYSLYVIHLPILAFLVAILFPVRDVDPQAWDFLVYALSVGAVLALSFLFAIATERHTEVLRRKILSRIVKRQESKV